MVFRGAGEVMKDENALIWEHGDCQSALCELEHLMQGKLTTYL